MLLIKYCAEVYFLNDPEKYFTFYFCWKAMLKHPSNISTNNVLSVCLSIYLFVYLSIFLSFFLSFFLLLPRGE
jgi:hypothetical protein